MRKIAQRHFEDCLYQDRINPKLFNGPTLNLEKQDYFIFEWASRIPYDGATKIQIYVPTNSSNNVKNALLGEQRDWWYVIDTKDKLVNEAMLCILFDLPVSPKDTSDRTKRLGKLPLTLDEMESVVDFIEIKRQILTYYFQKGHFPSDLYELILEWRLTRDKFGNKYSYKSVGDYVVLGTPGKNSEWDIDSSSIESIFADNEKEYIHKNGDDFLVKIKPVIR